ncbi:acid phosphatase 1-like [Dioscorea cayenensis subsp. rotundata]|uniref:Acid phosphatase 1-like n=1 Tax=Dioscorea cayennensis subsp. rotundata TaxID=55577 RepID=A0AB40BZW3_DIOCR|nr:acid phosphatase 1-like [Dioscorea cayenensis subsp. rotundata]
MKSFILLAILLLCISIAPTRSTTTADPHLPRPLILQFPSVDAEKEDLIMWCQSWRFAGEANKLAPWKSVPEDCAAYVKDYVTGKGYRFDLEIVATVTLAYARSFELADDGMDAWVFDIDETLLSNLPYYSDHGFGLEIFNEQEFDKWVDKASAPAIESSLKLYEEILGLGFKIFLLTGRSENKRSVTVENLKRAGFEDWEKLILREKHDHGKTATKYKSERRTEIASNGYRIVGNSGDQWSDLLGYSLSNRSFKLPNPMYFIP